MTIYSLGVNHRSASLDIREKVIFAPKNMTKALQNLIKTLDISEAAILSTCNRIEIYIVTSDDFTNSKNKILDWLTGYHQLMSTSLDGC